MDNATIGLVTFFQVIDWVVVGLVLCSGMFAKKYLADLRYIGKYKISNAIKTLFVSTVFVSLWALFENLAGRFGKGDLSYYFISYAVATSFYELLLKKVVNWLIGSKTDTDNP